MKVFQVPVLAMSLVGLGLLSGLDAPAARADFTYGTPVSIQSDFPFLDVAIDIVNCFSVDGLEVYFTHNAPDFSVAALYVARRATPDSEWGVPVNAIDPNVLSASHGDSSISADGLSLYFGRVVDSVGGVYVAKRATKQDNWGTPVSVGAAVNTADAGGPRISADELELYFGSGRPGGQGNSDIWVTTRATVNDEWGPPVNLGPAINSPNYDGWPNISPDGLLLFFCSNRPGAHDWGDIYMARRASRSAPWQPAVNLGPTVNATTSCWNAPLLSADGSTLYVLCDRVCSWTQWIYKAPILPIVDFNSDKKVDLDDLKLLIDNWGTNKTLYDIGPYAWGDGKVDIEDLKAFTAEWEKQLATASKPAQP